MTVGVREGAIFLEGDCPSGDAEELLRLLLAAPEAEVDWQACTSAHTAVVQVLLAAAERTILGPPRGRVLRSFVEPALARRRDEFSGFLHSPRDAT
jgi:hypothetical protein